MSSIATTPGDGHELLGPHLMLDQPLEQEQTLAVAEGVLGLLAGSRGRSRLDHDGAHREAGGHDVADREAPPGGAHVRPELRQRGPGCGDSLGQGPVRRRVHPADAGPEDGQGTSSGVQGADVRGGVDALGHSRHDGDAPLGQRPAMRRAARMPSALGLRVPTTAMARSSAGESEPRTNKKGGWSCTMRRFAGYRSSRTEISSASSAASCSFQCCTRASSSPASASTVASNSSRSSPASTASRNDASRKDAIR